MKIRFTSTSPIIQVKDSNTTLTIGFIFCYHNSKYRLMEVSGKVSVKEALDETYESLEEAKAAAIAHWMF